MHWLRNIPELSKTYRVIAPDFPGMGESILHDLAASLTEIARALASGIDEITSGADYSVIGFSFGAIVAGYINAAASEKIRNVILLGTGRLGDGPIPRLPLMRWKDAGDIDAKQKIHRYNIATLLIHDTRLIDQTAIDIQLYNAENTAQSGRALASNSDLKSAIMQTTNPIDVIWGEKDAIAAEFIDSSGRFLQARFPVGISHIIPDLGHWLQYENPQKVNTLMLDILRRHTDVE